MIVGFNPRRHTTAPLQTEGVIRFAGSPDAVFAWIANHPAMTRRSGPLRFPPAISRFPPRHYVTYPEQRTHPGGNAQVRAGVRTQEQTGVGRMARGRRSILIDARVNGFPGACGLARSVVKLAAHMSEPGDGLALRVLVNPRQAQIFPLSGLPAHVDVISTDVTVFGLHRCWELARLIPYRPRRR